MAKITITELTRRLGVSVCTVNEAISGKPKVSEKTRQRVVAEAEHRVPLVQLGLEVPGSPAVLTVRQDTLLSGRIAAELLSHFPGPVAAMIGSRETVDHDVLSHHRVETQKILVPPRIAVHGNIDSLASRSTAPGRSGGR